MDSDGRKIVTMASPACTQARKRLADERGIALMLVLWIMTILMGVVLSFAGLTRGETSAALAFRTGLENRFLAEAGIERGIMEILYRGMHRGDTMILEGREVWRLDGTPYDGQLGAGGYRVSVTDEAGKISINALTDTTGIVLKNLLIQTAGTAPEQADIIVDSILDWKDEDNLHRLNGAEDEYYGALPNPYTPRNAPFETVEELLLVRGMNSDILYGVADKPGIFPFIATTAKRDKINLAAAPRAVLLALPGMTPDAADRIMEYRKAVEIKSIEEVKDLVGDAYASLSAFAGVSESESYAITSLGFQGAERKGYAISAVVALDTPPGYRLTYYKSPAVVRP
jgi:general secretion pathway protein K